MRRGGGGGQKGWLGNECNRFLVPCVCVACSVGSKCRGEGGGGGSPHSHVSHNGECLTIVLLVGDWPLVYKWFKPRLMHERSCMTSLRYTCPVAYRSNIINNNIRGYHVTAGVELPAFGELSTKAWLKSADDTNCSDLALETHRTLRGLWAS